MIDYKKITLAGAIAGALSGLAHYSLHKDVAGAVTAGLSVALAGGTGIYAQTPTKRTTPRTDINS